MTQAALPAGRIPEITLSMRLRIAREDTGLDQNELADLSGVSRATISAAENGRTKPSRATISLIAFACGVDREWLATGDAKNPPSPDGDEGESSRDWIRTSNRPINSRMLCR